MFPHSIPQKSHAVVTSNNPPTFHPTSLATASQSHFLPHTNFSHWRRCSGGGPGNVVVCFEPRRAAMPLGLVRVEVTTRLVDTTGETRSAGTTLLVTHIWTVRDQPVVTPMTTHASRGRAFLAPRTHRVRYVAGQQRHWSDARRVMVDGRE